MLRSSHTARRLLESADEISFLIINRVGGFLFGFGWVWTRRLSFFFFFLLFINVLFLSLVLYLFSFYLLQPNFLFPISPVGGCQSQTINSATAELQTPSAREMHPHS